MVSMVTDQRPIFGARSRPCDKALHLCHPASRDMPPQAQTMVRNHQRIYQQARAYDVAFGFRDIPAECNTLAALVSRHAARPVTGMLELAAGPARHAREFARRGVAATALDSTQSMVDYALERAARDGVHLTAVRADMCDFQLVQRFDLVVLLMDSASYLLDNAAVLRHLDCVAQHLAAAGLYVLEMSHPRDAFGTGSSTSTKLTSAEDGLRVDMQWGAEGDTFDPITQVDEVTVKLDWSCPDGGGQIIERARQRRFTVNEFDALVRACGNFEIVEWLGSLAAPVPFSNDPAAWRMVPVLRKVTARA
jgi:SAM-dependent methyltransferase